MPRKMFAVVMLLVMLFSNSGIAVKSSFDYTIQPSVGNAPGSSDFDSNVNAAIDAGNSALNTSVDQAIQNSDIDWLRRLNIDLYYNASTSSWMYGASTIQPFALSFDPAANDMLFFQLNINKDSSSFYGNGGLGYRMLSDSRNMLYGLNAFYDRDFQNGHQRIGAGIEYFTRWLELRANGYYGISNPILTGQDSNYWYYQAVVNGFDYGVSLNVPKAEWLKLSATGYNNMQQYTPQTSGVILGASAQILPQLQLAYGYNMASSLQNTVSQVLKFDFNLGGVIGPVLFGSDNETKAIVNKDISYKLLQPVERQNAILTENYKTSKSGAANVSVVYSDGTALGSDIPVVMTANGNSYGEYTNSSGIAAFTGLPAATYTATALINMEVYSTSGIVVVSTETASPTITGPNNPGKTGMTVTVTYTDGTAVPDGTAVTASSTSTGGTNYTGTTTGGVATITSVNPGSYQVKAYISSQYYSAADLVTVSANTLTPVLITGPVLPGTGDLKVTLTDKSGTIIPNQTITVTNGTISRSVVTNSSGVASFYALTPGGYNIMTTINGAPYNSTATVVINTSTAVSMSVSVDLAKLQVTACYSDGATPMYGFTVIAVSTTNQSWKFSGVTNSSGVAEFAVPTSGFYYVYMRKASSDPYPPDSENDYLGTPFPVTVQVGSTSTAKITGPDKPKPPSTGAIKNIVIYNSSTGNTEIDAGTAVSLVPSSGDDPSQLSYVTGGISFTGLSFDTYTLKAGTRTVTTTPPTLAISSSSPEIDGVIGRLAEVKNVTVMVAYLDGAGVEGSITATNKSTGATKTVATSGFSATIPDLVVGNNYTMTFAPLSGSGIIGDYSYLTKDITISASGTNNVTLYGAYSSTDKVRTIKVTNKAGAAASGAVVAISPGSNSVTVGTDGTATTYIWYACDQSSGSVLSTDYTLSATWGEESGSVDFTIDYNIDNPSPDGIINVATTK